MATRRREFSPKLKLKLKLKRGAVALVDSNGRPQMQTAAKLGIQPSVLRSWQGARNAMPSGVPARKAAPSEPATLSPAGTAAENTKLRQERECTRIERDVPQEAILVLSPLPSTSPRERPSAERWGDHMRTVLALSALMTAA